LKYQVDVEFSKVYEKVWKTTSSFFTSISLMARITFLIWSSQRPTISGSYLGSKWSGCFGKLWKGAHGQSIPGQPWLIITLVIIHCIIKIWLWAIWIWIWVSLIIRVYTF
jgi:hypothetical protein